MADKRGYSTCFNEYNDVVPLYQNFLKTKDQCSQAMKQELKKTLKINTHHYHTMKTITKFYLRNLKCSIQEEVYGILPKLNLSRIFFAMYFVNTKLPEERVRVLFSVKQLNKLPHNSPNIFKKLNVA